MFHIVCIIKGVDYSGIVHLDKTMGLDGKISLGWNNKYKDYSTNAWVEVSGELNVKI